MYDDYNALRNGYKIGMKISNAKFCNILGSDNNLYLVGTQLTLKNAATSEILVLPYNGVDPTTFTSGQQYTCYDRVLDGSVARWYLGKRTYLSTTL